VTGLNSASMFNANNDQPVCKLDTSMI
jgi:hypothetical protein